MAGVAGATSVWRRSSGVLVRHTPRSLLISVPTAPEAVCLEGAVLTVWEQLAEPSTDAEIIAGVAEHLGVSDSEVSGNLTSARAVLAAIGAVVAVDG
jgi:hypothetical protein